ncbi:oxygenase MpaB family protein [Sphingomonas sp. PB4P5]|uniref:oxygenase MpaB family protein n=1 Tax=Parasphingomonas puruogangriensis TaxID=3096155 RepID=UPI002FCB60A3
MAIADLSPVAHVKRRIVGQVRAVFNDQKRGQQPVQRRTDGLFGPGSAAWAVHGDVTTMMVGGVASLLLQMLHPAVLAGVWDHSDFRNDMLGRLRRTARFIAVTTYGSRDDAEALIARIRKIHHHVLGTLPDGTAYTADDPRLLAWVHVTEMTSFLDAWLAYGNPAMSLADQDRYFAEVALIGEKLGADPVPRSKTEALALIQAMRPELVADARSREVAQIVLSQRAPKLAAQPIQAVAFQAAVDLLPRWAREMHGLPASGLGRPLVAAGTFGLAKTLRWAFQS